MPSIRPTQRAAGLLLHPTSFPGRFGIGDFGPSAYEWIEFLQQTHTGLWQILPLGPTGYGDSPYQCFSSFAGNPILVSPEFLAGDGLLGPADLASYPDLAADHVDYANVIPAKMELLRRATPRFHSRRRAAGNAAFDAFTRANREWLDDYALFMALKEAHGGVAWTEWSEALRHREAAALDSARRDLAPEIDLHVFSQFTFYQQWGAIRRFARGHDVTIVGDIPVYVAGDSSDVWTRQDLFRLEESGTPALVAGVPPDYFTETGQLWGNPIYDWGAHARDDYRWWTARLRRATRLADIVRIDHFRAFADYWEIPADAPTAITGRWVDGPGRSFFDAVGARLGGLPFIAEDLGELHAAVGVLRDELALPGMKVLQFAFATDDTDPFLPHNYPELCVAYTGTHDNEPIQGWWDEASPSARARVLDYFDWDGTDPPGKFLASLWASRANWTVAQLQDLLRLDSGSRMNTPGTLGGNWQWRVRSDDLTPQIAAELQALNRTHQRLAPAAP